MIISGLVLASCMVADICYARDTVRVRLAKNLKTVKLTGRNLVFSQKDNVSPFQTVAIPKYQMAEVVLEKVRPERSPFWAVKLQRSSEDQLRVFSRELYVSGLGVRVGLEPVPSKIRLVRNQRGRIDVITELDIETYLAGVLPSEMPAAWPLEALKAQAVASRTYMRKKMAERETYHFDLEASVSDQVFNAMKLTGAAPIYQRKVVRALRETQDQVLRNRKGAYITAYYHSDCGGETESPQAVWGLDGHDHARVRDSYCKSRRSNEWSYSMTRKELALKLAPRLGKYEEPKLKSLFVSERTEGSRVGELSVEFENHFPEFMNSQQFREVVGFDKIKSTRFTWKTVGPNIVFSGNGNGHGVGMCQWGVKTLALRGRKYTEILKHYYPKAVLKKDTWRQPEQLLQVPKISQGWEQDKAG